MMMMYDDDDDAAAPAGVGGGGGGSGGILTPFHRRCRFRKQREGGDRRLKKKGPNEGG